MDFREYQQLASNTDLGRGADLESTMVPLLGLSGEVGSLLTEYKKWLREGDRYKPFTDQVSEELGDILWYVATIASRAGLDLQEIADENLAKVAERWPSVSAAPSRHQSTAFDDGFPEQERLPRKLSAQFSQKPGTLATEVSVSLDGNPFGQVLTDNSHYIDGYRFHDIFHLSYAIMLGWSPVVRKLLSRKRKSDPYIDEVEDGARAFIMEEAISAVIFGHAAEHSFFEGAASVDYELLRIVRGMIAPFEVRVRTDREWEATILQGFEVWRQINADGGGVLIADADTGCFKVQTEP